MDENSEIDLKILRVLSGTATDKEREEINQWVRESDNNSFQFQKLKGIWLERHLDPKLVGHEEQKKKIWETYTSGNQSRKYIPVVPLYRRSWLRIAMVLAIILFPLYALFFQQEPAQPEEALPALKMVSKTNPTGQKSLIQLPDGSKVWLNSDSRISYHERFSDTLRSIRLEGEAYFEVVSDSLRPFVVDFESLSVTVLGTSFNISAFQADKDLRVTLVEGSVKVSNASLSPNLILEPGNGLIYSKERNDFKEFSKSSNPELFNKDSEWKNGKLIFDGRNFQDFVREIQRWYGVQVHVKGSPPHGWNIRASFENELLTNVMDAVSYNKGFEYSLRDKELTIMFH